MQDRDIINAIRAIAPDLKAGVAPEEAMLKYAHSANMPPKKLSKLAQYYNTSNVTNHLHQSDASLKGINVSLVDPEKLESEYKSLSKKASLAVDILTGVVDLPTETVKVASTAQIVEMDKGLSSLAQRMHAAEARAAVKSASVASDYVLEQVPIIKPDHSAAVAKRASMQDINVLLAEVEEELHKRFTKVASYLAGASNIVTAFPEIEKMATVVYGDNEGMSFVAKYLEDKYVTVNRASKEDVQGFTKVARMVVDHVGIPDMAEVSELLDMRAALLKEAALDTSRVKIYDENGRELPREDGASSYSPEVRADLDDIATNPRYNEGLDWVMGSSKESADSPRQSKQSEPPSRSESEQRTAPTHQTSTAPNRPTEKSVDAAPPAGRGSIWDSVTAKVNNLTDISLSSLSSKDGTGIIDRLGPGRAAAIGKAKGQMETDRQNFLAMSNLQREIASDAVIRDANIDEVIALAQELRHANPNLFYNRFALKTALREALSYGGIPSSSTKTYADTYKAQVEGVSKYRNEFNNTFGGASKPAQHSPNPSAR